ncbi:MAG: hypothetical protein GXO75_02745 [Calditrichaeota bacterium]|nr:hypothetical protein [Calditrichota bacterium]
MQITPFQNIHLGKSVKAAMGRMLQKVTILLLLFFIANVRSQDDSKILNFQGGRARVDFSLMNNLFYGIGGKSNNMGSISSFSHDASIAFSNPARLVLKSKSFHLDFIPAIQADLGKFIDLNTEIRSSTDAAISSYRNPDTEIEYTQLSVHAGQKDRLSSVLYAFPFKKWNFALYYHRQFDLNLNAVFSGFGAKINTKIALSEEKDDIFFTSFVDGHLSLTAGMNELGFAASRSITEKWSAGFSLQRYTTKLRTIGLMNVEGTMLFGGKENTFNDPNDNWYNNLNQSIDAKYEGNDWGWQIAGGYDVNKRLQINAVFEWLPDIALGGFMDLLNNAVPALNLNVLGQDSGGEEGILNASKLNLSQLTLTKKVDNSTYSEIVLRLPKTLKLGAAYRYNWLVAHLNYSLGMTPMSIVYGRDEIGFRPAHTLRTGFDLKYIQIGAGFTTLTKVAKGSENLGEGGSTLIIPLFSLGTSVSFTQNMHLNVLVVSFPTPILRTSFSVKF